MKDKVILVTGGSSGIGKATAIKMAGAGAKVILVARGEEKLIDYCKTIGLFRTNAKNVSATARLILQRHRGEVPRDRAALEAGHCLRLLSLR